MNGPKENKRAQVPLLLFAEQKTRIVHIERDQDGPGEGFDFLGYRFWKKYRLVRDKSFMKIKDTIREKTPRKNGTSLTEIIANVNRSLRGWFEYFKHSTKGPHEKLDSFIRRRLRSILVTRKKRRGHGWGKANWLYPNRYFAVAGLMSLEKAHAALRNPGKGNTINRRAGC